MEFLDLAGSASLLDTTLDCVLKKLFGPRRDVLVVDPTSVYWDNDGKPVVNEKKINPLFSQLTSENVLLVVNCQLHWCSIMVRLLSSQAYIYDPMGSSHQNKLRGLAGSLTSLLPAPAKRRRRYSVSVYESVLGFQADSFNCGIFVLVSFEMFCGASDPGARGTALLNYLRYRYLCMCF